MARNSYFTRRVHSSRLADTSNGGQVSIEMNSLNQVFFDLVENSNLQQLKLSVQNSRISLQARNEKGMTLLHMAVESGSIEVLKFLLEDGSIPLNAQDKNGDTALHLAVKIGNTEAMTMLLESGADDSIKNNQDDPPLHALLKATTCIEQLRCFLKHSVNFQVRGNNARSAFHLIVEQDNVEAIRLIGACLTHACSGKSLKQHAFYQPDKNGTPPLHFAAMRGAHQILDFMISMLLKSGIEPEKLFRCLDKASNTLLHSAVEHGHKSVVDVLLKHGASPTVQLKQKLPPCHLACSQSRIDIVIAMVESFGKEILQSRDQSGGTPVHHSSKGISDDLFTYVVENSSSPNPQDNEGNTPLHISVLHGNASRVDFLLSRGYDPFIANEKGYNALHLCLKFRRGEVFKTLTSSQYALRLSTTPDSEGNLPVHLALRHKFTQSIPTLVSLIEASSEEMFVFLTDKDGNNFLHTAAESGDATSLVFLLSHSCSKHLLNSLNKQGLTPLHFAAAEGSVSSLQLLIDHGAISQKSYNGDTPFMLACLHGHLHAAILLLETFPFVKNTANKDGDTALHLAARSKNVHVILMCLDNGVCVTLNKSNKSFFDLVLKQKVPETVTAILKHDHWEKCLDNCSPNEPHPVLRIIETIPEVFQVILDRSMTTCSSHNSQHSDYWEKYNFKYLTLKKDCPPVSEQPDMDNPAGTPSFVSIVSFEDFKDEDSTDSVTPTETAKKLAENPFQVLNYLITYEQKGYLIHPVIASFISTKWNRYAQPYYIFKFLVFLLFTILMSVFILVTPPPRQSEAILNVTSASNSSQELSNKFGTDSTVFRFLTIALAVPNLLLWSFSVYVKGLDCLRHLFREIDLWLHSLTLLLTFIFLIPWEGLNTLYWEVGAISIFLAWFTVAVDLQIFSVTGIFVKMMLTVTRNVFSVLIIVLIMIFAFAFPLYILVGTVPELTYSTIGTSLFTIMASLNAEIEYSTFSMLELTSAFRFSILTFIFLCFLTIMMPIVLINLLIGLAVGDIAEIQKEAILSQRRNEVHSLSAVEKQFPKWLHNRLVLPTYKHYPNRGITATLTKLYQSLWNQSDDPPNSTPPQDVGQGELPKEYHTKLSEIEARLEKMVTEQTQQQDSLKRIELMLKEVLTPQDS